MNKLLYRRKARLMEKLAGAKRYLRLDEQRRKERARGGSWDSPLSKATDRAKQKYERRISGPAVDRAVKFMATVPEPRPGQSAARATLSEIRRRPREVAGVYKDMLKALPRSIAYFQRVGSPLSDSVPETAERAVKAGPATGKKALKWRLAKKLLFKGKG